MLLCIDWVTYFFTSFLKGGMIAADVATVCVAKRVRMIRSSSTELNDTGI